MRMIFGIIIGVALTIGAAYVHDTSVARESTGTSEQRLVDRPMVNWDVVGSSLRELRARAVTEWNRLVG